MKVAILVVLLLTSQTVLGQQFVGYVDAIHSWYPATDIAAALGVPGYAPANNYTTINLSFWLTSGPSDAVEVWSNALYYCGPNPWGTTTAEIQKAWLDAYHSAGKKVLVSAFGATEWPTTGGADATQTAQSLAQFVIDNQLDGVDVDYEDTTAFNNGDQGVNWVVEFTNELRSLLPSYNGYLITHAPQAPYFMSSYADGGYLGIDQQCGSAIDWYNVQFYNQGSSSYDTYETLFVSSNGWASNTAILQIANAGVPLQKIVLGKPVTRYAASGGYVPVSNLTSIIYEALASTSWRAGVMGWEYSMDLDGSWIGALSTPFSYY